jgi:hypothetical protein
VKRKQANLCGCRRQALSTASLGNSGRNSGNLKLYHGEPATCTSKSKRYQPRKQGLTCQHSSEVLQDLTDVPCWFNFPSFRSPPPRAIGRCKLHVLGTYVHARGYCARSPARRCRFCPRSCHQFSQQIGPMGTWLRLLYFASARPLKSPQNSCRSRIAKLISFSDRRGSCRTTNFPLPTLPTFGMCCLDDRSSDR